MARRETYIGEKYYLYEQKSLFETPHSKLHTSILHRQETRFLSHRARQSDKNEKRAQRWDRKDWPYRQMSIRFVGCHCFLKQESQFMIFSISHITLHCTSRSSMIQDVALLHVISCTPYGTVSYRLYVVIRKIYVEIVHFTGYCTMRIECRHHSRRILRDNDGMGDV